MGGRDDTGPVETDVVEGRARRFGRGPLVAAAAVVCVVALVAWAVRAAGDTRSSRSKKPTVTTAPNRISTDRGDARARQLVAAAVATTSAAGSFHVTYHLTESSPHPPATTPCPTAPTPVPGVTSVNGVTIYRGTLAAPVCAPHVDVTVTGEATVNTSPFAMRASSEVSNFGPVTLVVDGTRVWEYAGTYEPTGADPGGQPLTGFAGLVESTLGQREGALAVQSLASPNGYLAITKATIADATPIGTGVFDGVAVTNYRVTIDPAATPSGVTSEEAAAIAAAREVLAGEGFVHTVQDVSIDASGFIRHTHSVAMFRDGGTMTTDDTFSQFGCAGTVAVPGGAPGTPAGPPDCVVAPPAAAPPTTVAPTSTTDAGSSSSTSSTTGAAPATSSTTTSTSTSSSSSTSSTTAGSGTTTTS